MTDPKAIRDSDTLIGIQPKCIVRSLPLSGPNQLPLFEHPQLQAVELPPTAAWELDAADRALDELFSLTFQYRTSAAYQDLMHFVARLRFYSPFNTMPIHIQMPGATFVAPPHRWLGIWKRTIIPGPLLGDLALVHG